MSEPIQMNQTSKVQRGMVFWYNPVWAMTKGSPLVKESDINPNGSIEFKRRPYVVVSNNTHNFFATTVNLVPVTTRPHGTLPCHVEFTYNDRPQVILTESIVTGNIADLDAYMYTLSPEIMAKVDEAIRCQLYVHENVSLALITLEQHLNDMIGRIVTAARAQQEATQVQVSLTNSKIEDIALNLATQVEDLLGEMAAAPSAVVEAAESTPVPPVEKEPTIASTTPKSDGGSSREPVEWAMPPAPEKSKKAPKAKKPTKRTTKGKQQKSTPQQTSSEGTAVQPKKPGKPSKYSVEFMVKYLRDFDIYPPRMMCDRYGINDRKALYPKKYYFINKLAEMGIDYKTYELPPKEGEGK